MPFTSEQLAYAGRAAIDFFLKNDPTDSYNVDRPLIEKLMSGKKEYGGGLQYVVEQLRYQNDSNFQSYFGDSQVSYNRKRTLQQSKFTWGAFHDGFGLNEDELTSNGITMTDDRSATPSDAEKVQLTNLLEENLETLKLGFKENFDIMLHRNGSQSATDIPGLDALVSTTPTTGVVGGIDPAVNTWWQNYVSLNIASGTAGAVTNAMETAYRACVRVGGRAPDYGCGHGSVLQGHPGNLGPRVCDHGRARCPRSGVAKALLHVEHQAAPTAAYQGPLDDSAPAPASVRPLCALLGSDRESGADDRQAQRARCSDDRLNHTGAPRGAPSLGD